MKVNELLRLAPYGCSRRFNREKFLNIQTLVYQYGRALKLLDSFSISIFTINHVEIMDNICSSQENFRGLVYSELDDLTMNL